MEQLTKTQELVRVVDEDEMRVILMGERPDGSLELEERTDGKLTFAAFGSLTCVRKVVLAASACTREEVVSFFFTEFTTLFAFFIRDMYYSLCVCNPLFLFSLLYLQVLISCVSVHTLISSVSLRCLTFL